MAVDRPRDRWTRRAFLSSIPAARALAADEKGQIFPTQSRRYADPATEFEVLRLTDPAFTSILPAYYGRVISRRDNFLLFSSDRTGKRQAFRMDLKSGESRLLTAADALDPASITLLGDDRGFAYFDGPSLRVASFAGLRDREVCRVEEGYERGPGFSASLDGVHGVIIETKGETSRLVLVTLARGTRQIVAEIPGRARDPIPRPKRAGVLYRGGDDGLWLVNYDGQQNRRLRLAAGGIGPANWSPDGRSVLYLHIPEEKRRLPAIREFTPDTNADVMVAPTSVFAHFGRNGDASVFVGASSNKASPHLLLLLRVTRRELTLCEHRASDPAAVAPIFSPNSQRVYFQSDRHGKPAIYSMAVDKLVESTETE